MRALKGRPLGLSHVFLADDGESPLTVDAPVSVDLLDANGVLVDSATATTPDAGETWQATFPAKPLGEYFASWSGGGYTDETTVEVVGGHLFTIPQAREADEYFADKDAFPASLLARYREIVESEFQDITARSFTTRVTVRTFTADGTGEHLLLQPDAQEIEAAWINGVAVVDLTGWAITPLGRVNYAGAGYGDAVRIRVRYGFVTPPPKVAQAAILRTRALVAMETSGIPDRATTYQPDGGGTFRLATPGMFGSQTGIPEVDATLKRFTLDTVLAVFAGA